MTGLIEIPIYLNAIIAIAAIFTPSLHSLLPPHNHAMKIYTVGGAVRDELLGIPSRDRDYVVVGASPAMMLDAGFTPVGADFPVFMHPTTHEEYALARTERKVAPGYKGFVFHAAPDVTLAQDLSRRDLTINAIAKDADGNIIDPYGGRTDLQQKILRHVSDAFREDPVRILRTARFAARFAASGFTVANDTTALMREMVVAGEVDALVAERVWQEIARGLMEATPSRLFAVLQSCGALARITPELVAITRPEHQVMIALDDAAHSQASLTVRFALITMALDIEQIESLCSRLKIPSDCRALALTFARVRADVYRALTLDAAQLLGLLDRADALRRPARFAEVLQACAFAFRASTDTADVRQPFSPSFPPPDYLPRALACVQALDFAAISTSTTNPQNIPAAIAQAKLNVLQEFIVSNASERTRTP